MSWRTVVVSSRCKLDLKLGYMGIRGEEIRKVFLDEIAVVMIENPAVSLTGCLLEALAEKKIRVILCGAKRLPVAELTPCYGSHDCSGKLRQQIAWTDEAKDGAWRRILGDKIAVPTDRSRPWLSYDPDRQPGSSPAAGRKEGDSRPGSL